MAEISLNPWPDRASKSVKGKDLEYLIRAESVIDEADSLQEQNKRVCETLYMISKDSGKVRTRISYRCIGKSAQKFIQLSRNLTEEVISDNESCFEELADVEPESEAVKRAKHGNIAGAGMAALVAYPISNLIFGGIADIMTGITKFLAPVAWLVNYPVRYGAVIAAGYYGYKYTKRLLTNKVLEESRQNERQKVISKIYDNISSVALRLQSDSQETETGALKLRE